MTAWAVSGQGSFITSDVNGGSAGTFSASSQITNQISRNGEMLTFSPAIDWNAANNVYIFGQVQASAVIGGNSASASASLTFQAGQHSENIVSASAEEHHDVNIPSQSKRANVEYSLVREGAAWALYYGLPSQGYRVTQITGTPNVSFTAQASANQSGSNSAVAGRITYAVIEQAHLEPSPIILPPSIVTQVATGGGILLLAGAAYLMSRGRRK